VGELLRRWVIEQLDKSGWSMRELARRASIDPSTISKVLSGEENPGPKFYQGVARAFGVTLESVERLDRDGIIPRNRIDDPDYKDLMEIAQNLTDDDLHEVLDYATYKLKKSKSIPQ
jgi:transcriptional regulator with XRE-family HTH domain